MANKNATISVRIEPEIKQQAEAVLSKIGIPVSVLIDTLYRQIIFTGGIPYPISSPKITTLDTLSPSQLNDIIKKGYDEAQNGIGYDAEDVFLSLKKRVLNNGI